MSFYRFNDTVTLYTPIDDGEYERHVITATKVQIVDEGESSSTRITIYIPIHGRRALKYEIPSKRRDYDRKRYTVKAGQKVFLGYSPEAFPPNGSYDVRRVDTHLSGSRHAQHIKILAYNIPSKEV